MPRRATRSVFSTSQSAWQHTHLSMRLCAAAGECLQLQLVWAQVGHVLQQGRVEWMISAACILTTAGHTRTGRQAQNSAAGQTGGTRIDDEPC